jgi:hypothetical protein
MMRSFWDAAVALDPTAQDLDEGRRFPLCRPEPLRALFDHAGLQRTEVRAIEVPDAVQGLHGAADRRVVLRNCYAVPTSSASFLRA